MPVRMMKMKTNWKKGWGIGNVKIGKVKNCECKNLEMSKLGFIELVLYRSELNL